MKEIGMTAAELRVVGGKNIMDLTGDGVETRQTTRRQYRWYRSLRR